MKKAIDYAYQRIFKFHSRQVKELKNISFKDNLNNKLEYRYVPISSVGIYVPGNLPSTLLMNSIPAKIARVKRIVLATPKINGNLNPAILYAAKKVGIKEIYSFGGAQAVASLAYIQKVDKIIGPGNKFVAEAKRQLSGKVVGTESMYAGPSEICVLADKKSNIYQVATSLVSQAEHDPGSQSILVTKDEITDPQNLSMWLDVNGKRMQDGSTKTMVYGVNFLISYLSRFMSLQPGDIISTGTPPGVGMGMKPQVFLKPGDVMKLGIKVWENKLKRQ